jgi:hypothetical protein
MMPMGSESGVRSRVGVRPRVRVSVRTSSVDAVQCVLYQG